MPIRKSVNELEDQEKQDLVDAILGVKDNGLYDQLVVAHATAIMSDIHRSPAFLPWHRKLLLEFETALQKVSGNPDMGVPYWDWAADAELEDPTLAPIWQDDLLGGDGDPNDNDAVQSGPFRRGRWVIVDSNGNAAGPLTRQLGVNVPTLPDKGDIAAALSISLYDQSPWNVFSNPSFRNQLEGWVPSSSAPGLHNRGHVWVGGSMLPMTSPNDPVFFFHHCMVDKLWADWQNANGVDNYAPKTDVGLEFQNYHQPMFQTTDPGVTPESVMDISLLGYSYKQTKLQPKPPELINIA